MRNEARNWESAFTATARNWGISFEWRAEELHRTEIGTLSEIVALHARYEDLVVVGGGRSADSTEDPHPELPADLVMTSGRPVLVVPRSGEVEEIGKRVLVCWNAGREAARAIHDGLPLLQYAEHANRALGQPRYAIGRPRRDPRRRYCAMAVPPRRHCGGGNDRETRSGCGRQHPFPCERTRRRPHRDRRVWAFPHPEMGLWRRDGISAQACGNSVPDVALIDARAGQAPGFGRPHPGDRDPDRASLALTRVLQQHCPRSNPDCRALSAEGEPVCRTMGRLPSSNMTARAAPVLCDRSGTAMAQTGAGGTPGAALRASPASERFPRRRQAGAPYPRGGP